MGVPKRYTDEFIEREAAALLAWMELPDSLYYKRFAQSRGYHVQRMKEWKETNEKFAEVFEFAQQWQEIKLVEGGLTNTLNAGFTKFILAVKFKWAEYNQPQANNSGNYCVNYGKDSEQIFSADLSAQDTEGT